MSWFIVDGISVVDDNEVNGRPALIAAVDTD